MAESDSDLVQDRCPAARLPAYIVRLLVNSIRDCIAFGDVHAELFLSTVTARPAPTFISRSRVKNDADWRGPHRKVLASTANFRLPPCEW
ncbi:hypothetical protein RM550_04455 [Streptomyces sp. DSM 41527]|uniref:Uncharacterized protein n=1 Tax=Streptomyces mooreae TaxID=3075523 RepID=A0ABU2T475_9ACTN|nr:hypothetical protein [Streptomyces sp. DSM 41527]MDT0454995.1 hypothetical protein [Streptomyces sp. DSM 41527]